MFSLHLGPLNSVSSINVSSVSSAFITLNWIPPFSLNITTAEPDILYCIDVYNASADTELLLVSNCNVSQPGYTFTVDNPDPRDLFYFIVTPRSNVEGARNGTPSVPFPAYFPSKCG